MTQEMHGDKTQMILGSQNTDRMITAGNPPRTRINSIER